MEDGWPFDKDKFLHQKPLPSMLQSIQPCFPSTSSYKYPNTWVWSSCNHGISAASTTVLGWCCLQAMSPHPLVRVIRLGKWKSSHMYTGFKFDPPDDRIERICIIQCWAMHVCSLLFSFYSYPRRGKNSVYKPKTTVFFILNLAGSKYCLEERWPTTKSQSTT